jgi:regulator of Ty1 transposition protein 103
VPEKQKLVFMYLANDIIQNSKKKGPEFGKEFGTLLAKAFKHIGESCREPKTKNNLDRILSIWEERGVYDNATIKEYYSALHCDQKSVEKKRKIDAKPTTAADASAIAAHSNGVSGNKKVKTSSSATVNNSLSRSMTKEVEKSVKTETVEVNGTVETRTVTLSPHQSFGDPPEPEELIKMIQDLENSASSDAVVREQIANLPPVVSEISLLAKIEDKEAAAKLATKVNDALTLLNDYNARLATEMDDRKKLNTMLKDFQQEQAELLKQAEQRLAVS